VGILTQLRARFAAAAPAATGSSADPATGRGAFIQNSGYDATKSKGRRAAPSGLARSEDAELPPSARRVAVSATRDIQRNFAIAGWGIRKHLDYITSFRFRSTTGNKALDKRIEDLIRWASRKENYDASGRHPLRRALRMAESRRIVDGDVFALKLSNAKIQWIEGDRVRTPYVGTPGGVDPSNINHGVVCGDAGQAIGYVVCRRAKTSDTGLSGQDMVFERIVRANWVYHHACWDSGRFDQVRGISPLAAAYNSFRDVYEGVDLALVKAKIAQLFALAIMRDAAETDLGVGQVDDVEDEGGDGEGEATEEESPYGAVSENLNKGPIVLDLEPGDKAEVIESATPSTEFQTFLPLVLQIALKSLDIPYSFYDEAHTNYSGQKQAWVLYEKSAEGKRQDNRDLLDDWTRWRLGIFIDEGVLELPAGMGLKDLTWSWRHAGTPWLDQLKEAIGNIAAIEAGLASPIQVIEEAGEEGWQQVQDEIKEFLDYRAGIDLPTPTWATDPGTALQAIEPADGGGEKAARDQSKTNLNTKSNRKSVQDLALEMAMRDREPADAR
jgi:capsid protein